MRDPRFASFAAKTRAVGARQKAHPQPGNEVAAAKKAAVPPSNDVAGQAKAAAVGDMTTAQPGVFDKAAFMTAVRAAIAKAVPENAKEADEFNSSGKAGAVKAEVKGQIGQGTQASARDIRGKATATPDPGRAVSVPAKPMAEAPQLAPAHDPGAATAMPTPAPPAQTDLSGAPREVNGQMADAGVTEQQLANSNEPQFTDALAAKKEGDAHSATAAAPVLAAQSQVITATKADAASQSAGVMGAIGGAHRTAFGAVGQQKNATKSGDELAKAQISGQLESIYAATKTETEGILTGLDATVDSEFESGEKAAKQAFEDYQSDAVSSWKLHRYLLPVGGLIQWGIDQFKPLSPELIKIFADARNLYMQRMDATISRVADIIGRELTRARTRIALGRQQMADFIGTQKGQMAAFAKEAGAGISDKFGELDKSVDEKQEGLVDDLASKYVEARKGIDDRITELQSENKGLWEQAQAAIAGAIETILKLKKMLESVLARAAGAVGKIIDDPMSFLGHLVAGVRAGLDGFVANIGTHLKKGLQEWLFGELASTGIEIPDKFDLKGIFTLVTSILGLTWTNFRTRLVAQIGEPVTAKIEKGFGIVKAIATTGIAGAWKWIVEKIGDLKSTVMDGIKSFVTEKIVMAGIQWLIGLLNPAAAFVKAVKMIYDLVMWFVDNAERIKELVDSVLGSVEEIIAGNVGKVAALIEGSLAKILPIAIGFLAGLAGVSGIGASIKKVVMSVQKPVNKVYDWLIGKAVKFGKGILNRIKNSKLAKKIKTAATKAKAWAKKKVTQAKAWGKKKIAGAKKWAKNKLGIKDEKKAKGNGEPSPLSRPFSLAGHSHTAKVDSGGHVTIESTPISPTELVDNYRKEVANQPKFSATDLDVKMSNVLAKAQAVSATPPAQRSPALRALVDAVLAMIRVRTAENGGLSSSNKKISWSASHFDVTNVLNGKSIRGTEVSRSGEFRKEEGVESVARGENVFLSTLRASASKPILTPGSQDQPVQHTRRHDAELKLLESFYYQARVNGLLKLPANDYAPSAVVHPDVKGDIWVHSDFVICPSCAWAMIGFQKAFPMVILHGQSSGTPTPAAR